MSKLLAAINASQDAPSASQDADTQEDMNEQDLSKSLNAMGIRKNNTLRVSGLIITKWGHNHFHIKTEDGTYIGVFAEAWAIAKVDEARKQRGGR